MKDNKSNLFRIFLYVLIICLIVNVVPIKSNSYSLTKYTEEKQVANKDEYNTIDDNSVTLIEVQQSDDYSQANIFEFNSSSSSLYDSSVREFLNLDLCHEYEKGDGLVVVVIDSPVDYRHEIFSEDSYNSLLLSNCYRVPFDFDTKEPGEVEQVIAYTGDFPSHFSYHDTYFSQGSLAHGTEVAAMVKQIAPHADIISMGVEVTNGEEALKGHIKALEYIFNHFADLQPDIITISYNSEKEFTQSLENEFKYYCMHLMEREVLFTISVDNDPIDLSRFEIYGSMGDLNRTIGVGKCYDEGPYEGVKGLNAYNGDEMDLEILAPGIDIKTAYYCNVSGNDLIPYMIEGISGTSFATPIVAGAAALIKAYNEIDEAVDIENIIRKYAIPGSVFDPNHDPEYYFTYYGKGILNIAGAMGIGDWDLDGLTDEDELDTYSTDPYNEDTDNDNLLDGEEVLTYSTDPNNIDTDNDGLEDGEEVQTWFTDPLDADTDNDGLEDGEEVQTWFTDPLDIDRDNDGLNDFEEVITYGTDPLDPDTDSDGLDDKWEIDYGSNPLVSDGHLDPDNDGADNLEEYNYGTNPLIADTDSDGILDGEEIELGNDGFITDPLDGDTDDDYLPDGWEVRSGYSPILSDTNGDGTLDYEEDSDGDGLTALDELAYGTLDNNNDTDGDFIPDYDEIHFYCTNPLEQDSDGDGLPDGWEVTYGLDPLVSNASSDPDNDGLTNLQEYNECTNPIVADSDGDGMDDAWELANNLDPLTNDSANDPDDDGVTNSEEYIAGSDPHDSDTDNDGMPDGWEIDNSLNPLVDDSSNDPDNDGLTNSEEFNNNCDPQDSDSDNDGLTDGQELQYNCNPNDSDTDNDGLTDGYEVTHGINPLDNDCDNDGLLDGLEVENYETDPEDPDTDNDGYDDLYEIINGTDPTDPTDYPGSGGFGF